MNPRSFEPVQGSRLAPLLLFAGLALMAPDASAQDLITRPEQPVVESLLRVSGLVFANFFQAPEEGTRLAVRSGLAEAQAVFPLARSGSLLHLRGRAVGYAGYSPTLGVGAGVRFVDGHGELEVIAGYDQRLPAFDVGDGFSRANVTSASGRYSLRLGEPLQVSGLVDLRFQLFPDEASDLKNNFAYDLGGAIAYTPFDPVFAAEAGGSSGNMSDVGGSESYLQGTLFAQVRSQPLEPLHLSARYRLQNRSFLVDDPTARNFGREDRRARLSLITEFRAGSVLGWHLYYALEDVDSSLPSRSFRTQVFGLGMSVRP